jgi:hypothetical protein
MNEAQYAAYEVTLDYAGVRQEVMGDVYALTYNDVEDYIRKHYPTATNINIKFLRTVGR